MFNNYKNKKSQMTSKINQKTPLLTQTSTPPPISKKQKSSKYAICTQNLFSLVKKTAAIGCMLLLAASSSTYLYGNIQNHSLITAHPENPLFSNQIVFNTPSIAPQETHQFFADAPIATTAASLDEEQSALEITDEEMECLSLTYGDPHCKASSDLLRESVLTKDLRMFNFLVKNRGTEIHPDKIESNFRHASIFLKLTLQKVLNYRDKESYESSMKHKKEETHILSTMLRKFISYEPFISKISENSIKDVYITLSSTQAVGEEIGNELIRKGLIKNPNFFVSNDETNPFIAAVLARFTSHIKSFLELDVFRYIPDNTLDTIFFRLTDMIHTAPNREAKDEATTILKEFARKATLERITPNSLSFASKTLSAWPEIEAFARTSL